jgi:hypothetical protein
MTTETRSTAAVGFTVFAGTMMIVIGVLHAIQGIVAIADDTFYVVGQEWVFSLDVTTWGWVHLILGIVVRLRGVLRVPRLRVGAGDRRRRGVGSARS